MKFEKFPTHKESAKCVFSVRVKQTIKTDLDRMRSYAKQKGYKFNFSKIVEEAALNAITEWDKFLEDKNDVQPNTLYIKNSHDRRTGVDEVDKYGQTYAQSYYQNNKARILKKAQDKRDKERNMPSTLDPAYKKQRKYYQENKEKIAAKNKEWREKNKEKISAKNKEYRQQNIEAVKEQARKYYLKNKDTVIKEYRERNHEHNKLMALGYYHAHKEEISAKRKELYQKNKAEISMKSREKYQRTKEKKIVSAK